MKSFVKVGLIFVAAFSYCGYSLNSTRLFGQEKPKRELQTTLSPEKLAQTKTLFGEKCARCHGADGRGQTVIGKMLKVPNFADKKWSREDITDERLARSIAKGKDEMPAFGRKLTKQEIVALAAYVRHYSKSER